MDRPTLQQLGYLVALADHRHFGRAAEACFVTQPALSNQIRELERRLGATLVERTSRGPLLTPAGRTAVAGAREALRIVDELVESVHDDGGDITGPLRLGVIPTMAPYLLPRIVPVIANRYPAAELRLRELKTGELVTEVREGNLDLGLLALPLTDDRGLTTEALARDPFLLAVPAHHALADRRRPLTLDVLADYEVLLLEDGHCLREQALDVCKLAGARARTVHDTSLSTLAQIVASGSGVTLLPASAAPVEARPGSGVTTRAFRSPEPARTIGLVWRGSSPRAENYHELARLVRPLLARSEP